MNALLIFTIYCMKFMIPIFYGSVQWEKKRFPLSTHIWEINNASDKQEVLLNVKC